LETYVEISKFVRLTNYLSLVRRLVEICIRRNNFCIN